MLEDFADKDFRDAFVEENIKTGLALQIRALREKAQLSQPALAKMAGKTQSVISRLEDPNYGKFTIRTLLDLAQAFDVALLVKFVSFSKLVTEVKDLSPAALAVKPYNEERSSAEEIVLNTRATTAASPSPNANTLIDQGALAARSPRAASGLDDMRSAIARFRAPVHQGAENRL
jgi:transcriptional regulator with XRE-family HTH domain